MVDPNSGKTKPLSPYGVSWTGDNTPAVMSPGGTVPVSLSFTNIGTLTWDDGGSNPVRLSYHWRSGACPGTANVVWDGLRTTLPGDIAPGGSVSNLSAQVRAPGTAGTYCLQYDVVREGITWFSWKGANTLSKTVTVSAPYRVTWGTDTTPTSMTKGTTVNVNLSFTNSGTLTWDDGGPNPVRLSYHWRSGACPGTANVVWDGLRTALPADVVPGGTVSNLSAQVKAPGTAGTYCLQYDVVREGITWFAWQGASMLSRTVTVN
jgi:hypothetical protein